MHSVAAWFAQFASAILLKVASSIDDVVWFAVFLNGQLPKAERVKNAAVYAAVCLSQTVIAYVISTSGTTAIDALTHGGFRGFSSERVLTLVAAVGLSTYSVKLLFEELEERYADEDEEAVGVKVLLARCAEDVRLKRAALLRRDDGFVGVRLADDDDDDDAGADVVAGDVDGTAIAVEEGAIELVESPPKGDGDLETVDLDAEGAPLKAEDGSGGDKDDEDGDDDDDGGGDDAPRPGKTTTKTLIVVAFCGSLDDLTLFVPMLVGGAIGPTALLAGAMVATALIVTICVFLNVFKRVSDALAAIPLVCITSVFATFLICKVIFMR